MAIAQQPLVEGARRRRWRRDEYYRMVEAGILGENERVELIGGEILELAAEYAPHSTGVGLVQYALMAVFGRGYVVRVQHPLWLGDSDPEPDVAVVTGRHRDYATEHPTSALLVVEVSHATLAYDRTQKLALYARAAIPEYWILNLVDRQLEVHRDPTELRRGGFGYRTRLVLRGDEAVAPLARPDAAIPVVDLLP